MVTDSAEIVVIGAGVVGLAIARHLARQGREVLIVEAESRPGTGVSARNSGVIHAGIYYPAGSHKAALCVAGRAMLYDYCRTRHVDHARCGKLVVGTSAADAPQLAAILAAAHRNGVSDVTALSAAEVRALEPALRVERALHSPSTGIVDVPALLLSLLAEAEAAGATLARKTRVRALVTGDRAEVRFDDPDIPPITARHAINAAGLHAPGLAAASPVAPLYAKGNYFAMQSRSPFSRLIYPVPEPGGLGIHLTLDLAGRARFGPDVEWVDTIDYRVDPAREAAFAAAIRRYWPGLPDGALVPDYAGIRPKAPGGDFDIVHDRAVVHLLGIESPGLTSCLAIARHVAQLIAA